MANWTKNWTQQHLYELIFVVDALDARMRYIRDTECMYSLDGFTAYIPFSRINLCADEYWRIHQIVLPGLYTTENELKFSKIEAYDRWMKLSFGLPAPSWIPIHQSVIFAEAFWFNWYKNVTLGNWILIVEDFVDSMLNDPNEWNRISRAAYDAGVDCQIKSWAAGVPIEHIIPVRIDD